MIQAVEEYGIKELNDIHRAGDTTSDISPFENLKNNLIEEAHHGALRIAGLVRRSFPKRDSRRLMVTPNPGRRFDHQRLPAPRSQRAALWDICGRSVPSPIRGAPTLTCLAFTLSLSLHSLFLVPLYKLCKCM